MSKLKLTGLLAGLLVLGLLAAGPARALEAKPQPYVVIVGVGKYADPHILPRPHAEADARALYDLLRDPRYLGVDEAHARLLLGTKDDKRSGEEATHANIVKALNWVADKAGPDDPVILVLIGEGAPLGDRTCYFASDSTLKDRVKTAVGAGEIEKALGKLKSQQFAAFIDVNFKGFKTTGKEKPPELNLANLYREFLGKEEEGGGFSSRVLYLANSGIKPSLDLDKHGVFTQVLLDGLKGKADTEGYEPDGRITVTEMAKYLRKEVPERVKKHAKTDEEKKQRAIALEGQWSDFTLTYNPAVMPTVKKRLARLGKLARENVLSAEVAAQGKNLLGRMPKLKAQQELRKAYEGLVDGKLDPDDFLRERTRILAKTRLDREDAREYALAILKATRILKAGYVKEVNQGQLVDWAVRGLFRKVEEKVPERFRDRLADAKKLKEIDLLKLLVEVREHLGKREDLAKGKDVTYTLAPMLAHLDKHTDYISPEILDQMRIETTGEFYGIGAHIRLNTTKDMLEIVSPIYGSPAYRAPLYAGDIVAKVIRLVDDQGRPLDKPEEYSTKGMSTDRAVKLIKGRAGTKVKLIIEREGVDHPLEFTITRARVELETVVGYKRNRDDRWNYYIDPETKIAYIRLTQFARNTFRDLRKVMRELDKQGINGLVLDLRFNPGGLLDSAVKVSDLFIDDGVIVKIRPRVGQETVYIGKHEESYLPFPMVCLINGNSASGSEIVSACLQDHGRALIVGDRSYGKGSVQTILPFEPTGGQLKMTNATFWRPTDRNLNKASTRGREEDVWGVIPDKGYRVKMSPNEEDSLFEFQRDQELIHRPGLKRKAKPDVKDRQLDLALKYLRGQIKTAAKAPAEKKAG